MCIENFQVLTAFTKNQSLLLSIQFNLKIKTLFDLIKF